MRKKHQAVLISSAAKKNFCNEISLGNFTYESEVKEQLRDFFDHNIKQEDLEYANEEEKEKEKEANESSDEEDSFEVSNIKVPKQVVNNSKEYAKFQISEKAVVSGIDSFNYDTIPQKTINICYDNSNYSEDNNKDLGATIKFFDIIKQYIFWKEKCQSKGQKDCELDSFQLFNLNPEKIKIIVEKISEFKKIAKEKKLDQYEVLQKFFAELETNYIEQKKELNNLIANLEYVDTVSYGKNWSVVGFQKVKIVGQ